MVKIAMWQKPQLRLDEEENKHRKVGWLELFFDLFFVVVFAQIAHHLGQDISVHGVLEFTLFFVPAWWVWVTDTYHKERFETEGLENRFYTFAMMVAITGMAVSAGHGLTSLTAYASAYLVARAMTTIMWIRGGIHHPEFRPVSKRIAIGYAITAAIIIGSMFVNGNQSLLLFTIGVVVDLLGPFLLIKYLKALPKYSSSKLPERFGLLTIIVLGETIVGVVNGLAKHQQFSFLTFIGGILGLAIVFCLWWIYFDFIGRRVFKPVPPWPFVWSYFHLPLSMGIIASGPGILKGLAHIDSALPQEAGYFLAGTVALSLISVGLLETTLARDKDEHSHPVASPSLKIGGALVVLAGPYFFSNPGSIQLFLFFLAVLVVQVIYASHVCFTTDSLELDSSG
ncbi:MAG: low temperature requirement protein A [Candidatus Riflebacteria bacterium]|nr:low temperature requirement protein A [Candidatus Riflebacteria bacterium]